MRKWCKLLKVSGILVSAIGVIFGVIDGDLFFILEAIICGISFFMMKDAFDWMDDVRMHLARIDAALSGSGPAAGEQTAQPRKEEKEEEKHEPAPMDVQHMAEVYRQSDKDD